MSRFDLARLSAPIIAALMIAAAAACSSGDSGAAIVADDDAAQPAPEAAADMDAAKDPKSPETAADTDAAPDDEPAEAAAETDPAPTATPAAQLRVGRDVGDRILDFSVTLEDGAVLTSSAIAEGGRPVFIYFLATWCPTCRKDMAEFAAIYPDFADSVDFLVVGQDPTEPIDVLVAYRDNAGHVWPVALAGPRMLADLRINTQAYKIALDADGVITYRAGYGSGDAQTWREVMADLSG